MQTSTTDDRQLRLVLAAGKVIVEQGSGAATLREIARAAGQTTGAIEHHFTGRHELLLRTAELLVDQLWRRVSEHRAEIVDLLEQVLPLDELRRQEAVLWLAFLCGGVSSAEVRSELGRAQSQLRELCQRKPAGATGDLDVDLLLVALNGIRLHALIDPDHFGSDRQLALLQYCLDMAGSAAA